MSEQFFATALSATILTGIVMQLSDQCFVYGACLTAFYQGQNYCQRKITQTTAPKITQTILFIKYLFHLYLKVVVKAVSAAYTCADQYVQVDGEAILDCMNM